MENNNVKNDVVNDTFTVNNIGEFYNLPKNKEIVVNGKKCKLLWDNYVWYGVELYGEITDVERAMSLLNIYRKTTYINKITDLDDDFINGCEPSDSYELYVKNESCTIAFSFYRTFSTKGYLNDIIVSPLVCNVSIYKELELEDTENRDFYFDVYGDNMLPKRHLYFPELDVDDESVLTNVFQQLANRFGRKYIFHEYGKPINIFEPEADK